MRILVVHNHYGNFATGGEAMVMKAEVELLRANGHCVETYERTNAELAQAPLLRRARLLVKGPSWSRSAYAAVGEVLDRFRPDLMHVHNYWLVLTPAVFAAAKDRGVATVLTLHNYRLACPGGQFLRDGKPCELCLGGSGVRVLLHRCYPGGSGVKSLLSWRLYRHTRRRSFHGRVIDAYVALSDFARKKFAAAGLPADRVFVKPNFMADPGVEPSAVGGGTGAVAVGRLSREKGFACLVQAWRDVDYPLTVIGDGPELSRLRSIAPPSVRFAGELPHREVLRHVRNAALFVFPSEWYEGFPLSLMEAMALGRAVVASDLGPRSEMISDGATGLLFKAGDSDDLRAKIQALIADDERRRQLGRGAREFYLQNWVPERNYEMLMDIYDRALARNRCCGGPTC